MNMLKDKIALITGASGGIGFAIARLFEQEGCRLALCTHSNNVSLEEFPGALRLKLDLADPASIQKAVAAALDEFGRIDILVNNAGIFQQKDFLAISQKDLMELFAVDFFGAFTLIQEVLPHMQKQKSGKIVNIASGAGILGSSRAAHYASAKAALITLSRSLAKLAGPSGININTVAPGFIETDMIKDILAAERQKLESMVPLGRIGCPTDVAKLVVFLSTRSSDYITGQAICVDGGQCMV